MSLYTTFIAFLSLDNTNMFSLEVTLERATYSWPCEKQSTLKSKPATLKVWPWDLLMVIAKDVFTGNCKRLNWNGRSDGIRGIRGINTSSPVPHPVSIVHSIMKVFSDFTSKRVPLQSLGGLRFLNKITGQPIFSSILWGGSPDGFKEFRNSVGNWTASSKSRTVSTEEYIFVGASIFQIIKLFTLSTCSLVGDRIALSLNQDIVL